MKRKLKKLLSLAMAALILTCVPNVNVQAAEVEATNADVVELEAEIFTPSDYVNDSEIEFFTTTFVEETITVNYTSEGMVVNILTATNRTASYVGVKDIEIQKKVWYGWETVAVSSGGASYNVASSVCRLVYGGAVKGETYRVRCTHYADVDGYAETKNETSGYKWS